MKFIAKLFWPLLPVMILAVTYREAGSSVKRYWALASNRQESFDTYRDLEAATTLVSVYYKTMQSLPADLPGFLTQMREGKVPPSRKPYADAWGTPYQLQDKGDSFDLVSCGPDKDCAETSDNLVASAKKIKGAKLPLPVPAEIQEPPQ